MNVYEQMTFVYNEESGQHEETGLESVVIQHVSTFRPYTDHGANGTVLYMVSGRTLLVNVPPDVVKTAVQNG